MSLTFEWDRGKAKHNLSKHGITFEEAATVFSDVLSLTINDPIHSDQEDRYVTIGKSDKFRVLIVVHTDRGDNIRIISSRIATKYERQIYEENE